MWRYILSLILIILAVGSGMIVVYGVLHTPFLIWVYAPIFTTVVAGYIAIVVGLPRNRKKNTHEHEPPSQTAR